MCGRYLLARDARSLAAEFGLAAFPELAPRYNIAPSQTVPAVRAGEQGREASLFKWGLVPFWADSPAIGNRLINARAESVASKPAFRAAFKRRRCLVPADGYYEWQTTGARKQPYCIRAAAHGVLAFAGLWEHWERDGSVLETVCLLTGPAVGALRTVHDRMPVMLSQHTYAIWLDPESSPGALDACLVAAAEPGLEIYAVSTYVNTPRHDGPECCAPLVRA
jgi:putative SOS response-associated peptidase YedK